MKTKLLSSIAAIVLFAAAAQAQKTWDFGNDHTTWPLGTGYASHTVVDNLGMYANDPESENPITNFGAITTNSATFPDGFTATYRFQMNGAGYSGSTPLTMPTQRFLHFDVSGSCTVKIWFKTGSNGAQRTIYVSDGTNIIGSATTNSGSNNDFAIVTAAYTGPAAKLFVYGSAANNLYKMQVIGATVSGPTPLVMGNDDFSALESLKVFAHQKQVNIANVTSPVKVDVYSLTGALVKTVNTDSDTSFELSATGLYIVNLTSGEGRKSVKVVVQ